MRTLKLGRSLRAWNMGFLLVQAASRPSPRQASYTCSCIAGLWAPTSPLPARTLGSLLVSAMGWATKNLASALLARAAPGGYAAHLALLEHFRRMVEILTCKQRVGEMFGGYAAHLAAQLFLGPPPLRSLHVPHLLGHDAFRRAVRFKRGLVYPGDPIRLNGGLFYPGDPKWTSWLKGF